MSADIQFGEVQEAEPNRGIRPDRDAHFCVVKVGDLSAPSESGVGDASSEPSELEKVAAEVDAPDETSAVEADLAIFVEMDVMRDMEIHARSNTNVELGGVLLGCQRFDEDGVPFVVITECLRAEHYEATRGSFKFTHDTWSQITDQRARFHPELEMVGWYHTHPGWGIFLSGMDLFICNNFFNRSLDVALVIDPVAHERGWFQWVANEQGGAHTRETRTFYLMTNRYRESELRFFASAFLKGQTMSYDPRFSQSQMLGGSQPIVNITDNRRSVFDMAIIAMLLMQFLFLVLIAWRLLIPPPSTSGLIDYNNQQVYEEVLASIVEKQTGDSSLVNKYADQRVANTRLAANLDGQILRSERLATQLRLTDKEVEKRDLALQKEKAKSSELETRNETLVKQVKSLGGKTDGEGWLDWDLVYSTSLALVALLVGGAGGFWIGGRNGSSILQPPPRGGPEHPRSDDEIIE